MKRKLTIRTKLAAALAVPLTVLAVFAALQVRGAYDTAVQVKQQAAIARSATSPDGVLSALEHERDYMALSQIGKQDLVDSDPAAAFDATARATDKLLSQLRDGGSATADYAATLLSVRSSLTPIRRTAQQDASKVVSAAGALNASKIFNAYNTQVVDKLLDADQQSSASIDDAQLRSGAELLNAVARQSDVEDRVVLQAIMATLANDRTTALQVQRSVGEFEAGEGQLALRAVGPYQRALNTTLQSKAHLATVATLRQLANDPLHVAVDPLLKRIRNTSDLGGPQATVGVLVNARAATLTSDASSEEFDWIVATVGSLLLAMALLWLANKWITRPLRALADQASAMAGTRLPEAVKHILETSLSDDVERPELPPVHVKAGGEIREVEAALNRVQESAISLAVEQASMRRNVADAYVNLGRRNQNLLSRQLEFITQLENEESDPETLEHLFRLDHLATRMRRNAESLLVLAGHAPPRTWSAPVPVADVVRGALGEVEGYQRVRLRHLDEGRVDGAAAADVSHVIAELVENALAFSPPDADVEVYGRLDEHGYVLTVVDSGIGMSAEELERANELIASPGALTVAPSRFLGHYVVAQLAKRHDLAVHLTASPAGGVTALIALPAEMLGLAPPRPVADTDGDTGPAGPDRVEAAGAAPPVALPRRAAVASVAPLADVEPEPAPVPEPAAWVVLEPEPEPAVVPEPAAWVLEELAEPELEAEPEPEPEPELELEP
ncbi:MAG TPA: ATP-binding protein, partial [Acidimicrobiia bacterium]|nr:ATP-binding protein [Acidimicrobiia bacterium]